MTADERHRFDRWARLAGHDVSKERDGSYRDYATMQMHAGWLARAALAEPDYAMESLKRMAAGTEDDDASLGRRVRSFIEAAGRAGQ